MKFLSIEFESSSRIKEKVENLLTLEIVVPKNRVIYCCLIPLSYESLAASYEKETFPHSAYTIL